MAADAAFERYTELLFQLHDLIARGEGESPLADDVRDRMDGPWDEMDEAAIARVRGLSGDLYSTYEPYRYREGGVGAAELALRLHDWGERWDEALEALRNCTREVPEHKIAYLRASAWRHLGAYSTAARFFKTAVAHAPDSYIYRSQEMDNIGKLHEYAGVALDVARKVLLAKSHPYERIAAALVLQRSSNLSAEDADLMLTSLRQALRRLEQRPPKTRFPSSECLGQIIVAYCERRLGDHAMASVRFDKAVALMPRYWLVYAARGGFLYGRRTEAAVTDLREAVRLGAPLPWPFLFLAHHSLENGDFSACRSWCERGLRSALVSDAVRSKFWEWLAISRSELGDSSDVVLGDFRRAIESAPTPQAIGNYAEYLKHVGLDGPGVSEPVPEFRVNTITVLSKSDNRWALQTEAQLSDSCRILPSDMPSDLAA